MRISPSNHLRFFSDDPESEVDEEATTADIIVMSQQRWVAFVSANQADFFVIDLHYLRISRVMLALSLEIVESRLQIFSLLLDE